MTTRELAVAMMRVGSETLRLLVLADPALVRRHGFSVATRDGLTCFASTALDAGVFNHVSGYGTYAPATQRGIDAVLRHYDALGRDAAFEVLMPFVSRSDLALLERNRFKDRRVIFQCHLRTSTRAPRARVVAGLTVDRVTPPDAARYARLASEGFGDGNTTAGKVFERGWTISIREGRRVAAFMGRMRGTPAASGVLFRGHGIAGLYSGSVLRRFRGRGIQNAMIAARLAYGWSRGVRDFYSWSDPDNASARNLRDEGFITRYEVHWFSRS